MRTLILTLIVGCLLGLTTGDLVTQTQDQQPGIFQTATSGDEQTMAVQYLRNQPSVIDFFDTTTRSLIHSLDASSYQISKFALSPTGDRLVWVEPDTSLYLYDVPSETVTQLESALIHGRIEGIYWSPTDDSLIAYVVGGGVFFYNVAIQDRGAFFGSTIGGISFIAFSPDGSQIATSHIWRTPDGMNTGLEIWNVPASGDLSQDPIVTIPNIGGLNLAWSPDGQRVAVIGNTGLGYDIYNVASGELEATRVGMNEDTSYYEIAWSPDGDYLATGGNVLRIWDASDFTLVGPYSTSFVTTDIVWSPDGEEIFTENGEYGGLGRIEIVLPTDDPD